MHTSTLQKRLARMTTAQLLALSLSSGVHQRTLWKIRSGETKTAAEETKRRIIEALKK
ncbi:MAG: hypothetical protein IPO08_23115 [Xanthomonadales bacterium]|nr:hypothetical protein [Xanthomonadales bacterium]